MRSAHLPKPTSAPTPAVTAPIQRRTTKEFFHGADVRRPSPGSGRPLPPQVRGKMERALGHDFSQVRVHVGPEAAQVGAIAYARGTDLHFQPGRYDPHSRSGQALLGHELAHVVQQAQGRVSVPQGKGAPINADPALEAEADRMGERAARGDVAASAPPAGADAAMVAAPVQRSVIQRNGEKDKKPWFENVPALIGSVAGGIGGFLGRGGGPRGKLIGGLSVLAGGAGALSSVHADRRKGAWDLLKKFPQPMPYHGGEYDMPMDSSGQRLRHASMYKFSTNLPSPPPRLSDDK